MDSSGTKLDCGIDVVSISRIQGLLKKYPEKFRSFAFTQKEQQYCEGNPYPAQHYAGYWTIKESYIKAVGDTSANTNLTSIEITRGPTPEVSLSGESLNILQHKLPESVLREEVSISISLAHEQKADLAIGIVIISF